MAKEPTPPGDLAEIALDLGAVAQHRLLRQHVITLQQAVEAYESTRYALEAFLVDLEAVSYAFAQTGIAAGILEVLTGQGLAAPVLDIRGFVYATQVFLEGGPEALASLLTVGRPTTENLFKIQPKFENYPKPRDAFIRELFDRALFTTKTARCKAVAYKRC